uniref:Gypsy retrotransposon integrase-like protein 1 n=1 Tax=Cyprinus carpio carpio TaxID=630221 RepID=A0A9J7XUR9_CYPCA
MCHTGANVLVRGIEMGCISIPLHNVNLKSDLVTGLVQLGVCKRLPVDNVGLILGNDLAGGNVFPSPIVVSKPTVCDSPDVSATHPLAFPACAVTRSQSRSFQDVVDLSDSFLSGQPKLVECKLSEDELVSEHDSQLPVELHSIVGREHLAAAQNFDPSLVNCISAAVDSRNLLLTKVAYFWDDGILMRKWQPMFSDGGDWQTVYQIVLPSSYRSHVLKLAHANVLAGHLGVTKTFQRIVKHFYWPGIKSAVSRYCRSCDICQRAGKPNQTIPKAPLQPIPVIGEPFERLVIDCVGPLPKSKHGHQYILTIMCTATRYPEAIPLRTLKAQVVLREVVRFCTTFGLPRVIQTDQGSNFTLKVFGQMLKELGIKHHMSSAYHPESQGAVERFHQTLKTLLRTFCIETGKDWVDGLPLLMFAVRESVQESLGFSPAELVFAHTVRGPLKLLKEQLIATSGCKCCGSRCCPAAGGWCRSRTSSLLLL